MAAEQTPGRARGYVILERREQGWIESGIVEAASADAAIRAHVDQDAGPGSEGRKWELVAVPARSWRPVTVARRAEWRTVIDGPGEPEPDGED